jgi:hypothetical protein
MSLAHCRQNSRWGAVAHGTCAPSEPSVCRFAASGAVARITYGRYGRRIMISAE